MFQLSENEGGERGNSSHNTKQQQRLSTEKFKCGEEREGER